MTNQKVGRYGIGPISVDNFALLRTRVYIVFKDPNINLFEAAKGHHFLQLMFEDILQIDYRPINIEEVYRPPIQGPQSARDKNLPKLDDYTINKHFFKRWQVEPRVRHGDFHENHSYVPPQSKFDSITTTGDTFTVPQGGIIPASFKPEHKRIVTEGSQDFNTMYRSYYTQPSKATQLTKKQQAQLYRELMKRKGNRQDVRVSGQNTKPIVAK